MNLNEKEKTIIEHYGVLHQLKYFYSEIFELTEAIINHELFMDIDSINSQLAIAYSHLCEEISDVQMMLNQFKRFYNVSDITIDRIMNEKANRQLERINNE